MLWSAASHSGLAGFAKTADPRTIATQRDTQLMRRTSSVHMQINQSQIPTPQTALLSPNTKLSCSGPLLSCLTRSYTFGPLQSFRLASPVLSLTVKAQQSPHQPPEPLSPDHFWCFQTSLWGNVSNQLSF